VCEVTMFKPELREAGEFRSASWWVSCSGIRQGSQSRHDA
jgi:hypothetical protein